MKPETVLGIKYREEPTAKLQEWLKEYAAIAAEFPGAEDLAQRLSKRAEKAGELITERNRPEPPSSSQPGTPASAVPPMITSICAMPTLPPITALIPSFIRNAFPIKSTISIKTN